VNSGRTRLLSLDALRGLAVLLMIEQHLGVWLWHGPRPGAGLEDYWPLVALNALGGGAAPLFVTLAGVGSALFSARSCGPVDRTIATRGLVLMGFGLALNLVTPSWFSWGSWFVLHMMGFAMVLAPLWRRLPTSALLGVLAAVLVGTALVQSALDTPEVLRNARMRDTSLPGGALRLALAEGQFPVLPWLAFYLGGFAAGRWIVRGDRRSIVRLGAVALVLGAALAGAYLLHVPGARADVIVRATRVRLGFYPASPAFVLVLLGAVLLATSYGLGREGRRGLSPRGPLVALGRCSLTLLVVHVPLFRELTRPMGLWRALPPAAALAVIGTVIVACIVLARAWERRGYRYGAEWLLRKLAG
jgi:uncharacterized membrane protein